MIVLNDAYVFFVVMVFGKKLHQNTNYMILTNVSIVFFFTSVHGFQLKISIFIPDAGKILYWLIFNKKHKAISKCNFYSIHFLTK